MWTSPPLKSARTIREQKAAIDSRPSSDEHRRMIVSILLALAAAAQPKTDFGVRVPGATQAPHRLPRDAIAGSFTCHVSRVSDGDSFKCRQGPRVRLAAIDAPEMPGSCRPGRKCAPGDPYAAKAALSRLIAGKAVRCEPVGQSYNRIAAWCSSGGTDLSCAMVRSGHAVRLQQYDRQNRICRR